PQLTYVQLDNVRFGLGEDAFGAAYKAHVLISENDTLLTFRLGLAHMYIAPFLLSPPACIILALLISFDGLELNEIPIPSHAPGCSTSPRTIIGSSAVPTAFIAPFSSLCI